MNFVCVKTVACWWDRDLESSIVVVMLAVFVAPRSVDDDILVSDMGTDLTEQKS